MERRILEVQRLYCVIPKSLFRDIASRGLLKDIDNIVSTLLSEYVEEFDRKELGEFDSD